MLYEQDITIPANTSRNDQIRTDLKVHKGVIYEFEVVFPPGCAGLVKCAIFVGGEQIIPFKEGTYLKGDTFPVRGREYVDLKNDTNEIHIYSYNEDEVYDHTIIVRLFILPKEVILPAGSTEGVIKALKALFTVEEGNK